MALVPCPDCHRLLSPLATHCPQCGRPAGGRTGRATEPFSAFPLAVVLILAGSASGLLMALMASKGFWLPGLLFGIGFSLAARFRPHLLLSFSSVTAFLYLIAYFAGSYLAAGLGEIGIISTSQVGFVWGAFSGAIGSFLVLQVIALFSDLRTPLLNGSVVLAGTLIGCLFVEAVLRSMKGFGGTTKQDIAVLMTGFALWQSAVGVLCQKVVRRTATRKLAAGSFSLWMQQALTGPAVQFLGLVGTLLGLVQMFWGME